jgi:ketosteroid isomerase-like protein
MRRSGAAVTLLAVAAFGTWPACKAAEGPGASSVARAGDDLSPAASDGGTDAKATAVKQADSSDVARQSAWIRAYVEAFNRHDAPALAKLYAPTASYVELSSAGGESTGTAAIESDYATLFSGFADVKLSVTRSWHVKQVVAFEFVEGGSGLSEDDKERRFGITGAHLVWFDGDGRVTRDQIYEDDLTLSNQLGWGEPPVSKIPVRPVRDVPTFSGTWEQHVANGSADEAKGAAVRDGLYANLLSSAADKEFLNTVTDDIVVAEFDDPEDAVGKPGVAAMFKSWHKTFSNMKIVATHAWSCGPFVVFEGVFSGKQSGAWGPLPATNREFVSHFLDVTHVRDGKVDRLWTYASSSEILGLHAPSKAQTAQPLPKP